MNRITDIKFTQENVTSILAALLEGGEEAYAVEDYSGRGMCGTECFGFVVRDADMAVAVIKDVLFSDGVSGETVDRWMEQDDMGLGQILYFPHVTAEYTIQG